MKGGSTYRAGIIAYISITVYVMLAAVYLLLAARFDGSVQELNLLVSRSVEVWRRIATLSDELVRLPDMKDLPPHVLAKVQSELKELLEESKSIDGRIGESVAKINEQLFAGRYKERLSEIMRGVVKPSVQKHVNNLASTPAPLLEARYTSPLSIDAVLLKSGAALDPLQKKKDDLSQLHDEIVNGRAPMEMSVLAVLLISVWSSWIGLLRPSLKRAELREEQLMAAEERSRVTLNSIGDAVIVADAQGRLESMNPIAEKMLDLHLPETQGRPVEEFLQLYRSSDGMPIECPITKVLATGIVAGLENGTTLKSSTGESRVIADAAAPIRYPDGKIGGAIVVFRDVTEEHALRESLMLSDKLRAVGLLAGGMAHEFNNALAIISGACELIKAGTTNGSNMLNEQRRHFEIVEQAVKRTSSLTNRLLAIGRRTEIAHTPLDLLRIIEEAVEVLRRTHDRCINIEVDCALDASRRVVLGDAPALQSVFINLGLNSIQSIEGAGRIDVSVVESGPPLGRDAEQSDYVSVVWSDNGQGIATEYLDRIFEPFFTTKSETGGSGLGLSVIQSTISVHSGTIEVQSKPSAGTAFTIHLPTTDRSELLASAASTKGIAVVSGTILIVDDEASFLTIVAEYLTSFGYRTLTASKGIEALDLFTKHKDEIDVIVLDMNMPEISGPDIARKICALRPDSNIIISSGYANCSIDYLDPTHVAFLKKPYDLKDLLNAIGTLLNAKSTDCYH